MSFCFLSTLSGYSFIACTRVSLSTAFDCRDPIVTDAVVPYNIIHTPDDFNLDKGWAKGSRHEYIMCVCVEVPLHTVYVKRLLLMGGDIESNPGPAKICPYCNGKVHIFRKICNICNYGVR